MPSDDEGAVTVRIAPSIGVIGKAAWDACAGQANPFVSYDFLTALEDSGSVGPGTGWQAAPIIVDGTDGAPAGIAPAWLKEHSQGEYVFDHSWAEAWQRAGGNYYPKLQIAVPFSPVPGPRLLLRDARAAAPLIAGLEAVVDQNHLSSAHMTFVEEAQVDPLRDAGWLIRQDSQFHWTNEGYADFAQFLSALSSRHRKDIRKERARAQDGLDILHLRGAAITPAHWDAFWAFYQDTGNRKWGQPYLTHAFFPLLGARLGEKILLILALRDGQPIAGALNLIGEDTLYGRYWGCVEDVPFLHFELCYYQAIDAAIAQGLRRVEAGAQGGHKLARGYRPEPTWSAHYIPNAGFRRAVAQFLAQETAQVEHDRAWLATRTPFRRA